MYLVYRRDGGQFSHNGRNVYVALHETQASAIDEINQRLENEDRAYFTRERMSWPIRMSAAIACGQEFTPNRMEEADCQI